MLQGLANVSLHLIGPEVLGQRIHGHDLALGIVDLVERLHAGMIHLPVVLIPARLAAERQPLAVPHLTSDADLVEPDAFETFALVVGQDDADDPSAVVEALAVDFDDFALHGLQGPGGEIADGPHVAEIVVGSR